MGANLLLCTRCSVSIVLGGCRVRWRETRVGCSGTSMDEQEKTGENFDVM